jgi:hypothetical protein
MLSGIFRDMVGGFRMLSGVFRRMAGGFGMLSGVFRRMAGAVAQARGACGEGLSHRNLRGSNIDRDGFTLNTKD